MRKISQNSLTFAVAFFCCTFFSYTQDSHFHNYKYETQYLFKQNKGQFHENVLFKTNLSTGNIFLEKTGITYSFVDYSFIRENHENNKKDIPNSVKGHCVKVKFFGANKSPIITQKRESPYSENYFIGNDKTKWASGVKVYNEISYKEIYKNIDFKIYENEGDLKYDFIVASNSNPQQIKLIYEGANSMYIKNGILYVKTSITDIVENKPFAYQYINGEKKEVKCNYKLEGNIVQFEFPEKYDKNLELIIDPIIIFSTYSGSTSDNKGFAATYDTSGNTYTAGIVFGSGYPFTTGAYDTTWAGSSSTFPIVADITISKFDTAGAILLYSTYLGGNNGEVPHSLITNNQGELYIYGTTGSNDFPMSSGCYDNSFNGGINITPNSCGVNFSNGTDIFITKLNTTGTAILGSTFMGGTSNDGINTAFGLAYNHGDEYRGEIILDNSGNCYVVSTTNSTNFPVVSGSFSKGGFSDVVTFKLNSNLSSLLWSTYFGGTGNDAGNAIDRDASGNIFITGGTMSSSIDNKINTYNGSVDGFLAKYNSSGVIQTSRYLGTSSYDQSYFVQVDVSDDVFVLGQTLDSMAVTPGKYSNAGGHQFIQKFNNSLTTLEFVTTIGSGGTSIDFSPTAFYIRDCGMIYICGWGGLMNVRPGGSTFGLPTKIPYQGSTTGSDFYIMLLEKDALNLLSATFMGGVSGAEHVDGGMSRFDEKGNIYQAVCAGCNNTNDFPITTGVWSGVNGSTNKCNLGVFKLKTDEIISVPTVSSITICNPSPANFGNASILGNTYLWDFGDGTTSTSFAPNHNYLTAGTFVVTLVVSDSNGCLKPDIDSITVHVYKLPNVTISPDTSICPNSIVQLFAYGATTFTWSPVVGLNNPSIFNPIAAPSTTTTYVVIGGNVCGNDTNSVTVTIKPIATTISQDTSICLGGSAMLQASGGGTYSWSPTATLTNSTTSSPTATPVSNTKYTVLITAPSGCTVKDSVTVSLLFPPVPVLSPDITKCAGQSTVLFASGAKSYFWYPSTGLSSTSSSTVTSTASVTTKYFVNFINTCGTLTDSVTVTIIKIEAKSSLDDTICYNQKIQLWATGGKSYSWTPAAYCSTPNKDTTFVNPPSPIRFRVIVDSSGCSDTAYTKIDFSPIPTVDAGLSQKINIGEEVQLYATHSFGTFFWTYSPTLNCDTCENTIAYPLKTTYYYAHIVDSFGCSAVDSVRILIDGSLFIPNTFTPNGDYKNEVFRIYGDNILEFKILIFNRWGDVIYESNDINEPWDGKNKGEPVKTGTYIWKISYLGDDFILKEKIGHVNVLR